jgi:mannose-6-phosphate isomerase-like protein (cupin superfamily)
MISKETAEHYTWGENCDGWHLLKSVGLSVIQERMPPQTSEVKHFHERSNQFFYILSGEAAMEIEGEPEVLKAGQGIEIPCGTAHQIFNKSDAFLEFIVVSAPPSHGDRILLKKYK